MKTQKNYKRNYQENEGEKNTRENRLRQIEHAKRRHVDVVVRRVDQIEESHIRLSMQREYIKMLQYEEQIRWRRVRSKEVDEDLEKL